MNLNRHFFFSGQLGSVTTSVWLAIESIEFSQDGRTRLWTLFMQTFCRYFLFNWTDVVVFCFVWVFFFTFNKISPCLNSQELAWPQAEPRQPAGLEKLLFILSHFSSLEHDSLCRGRCWCTFDDPLMYRTPLPWQWRGGNRSDSKVSKGVKSSSDAEPNKKNIWRSDL